MITRKDILHKTHYGLKIFSHILQKFHPGETVLYVNGNTCKPVNNPFLLDKHRSLQIEVVNNEAVYHDIEQPGFCGNVFDFAQLYFKTATEEELLLAIHDALNLRLIEQITDYELNSRRIQEVLEKIPDTEWNPKFSYYKSPIRNIYPAKSIGLQDVYNMIKDVNRKYKTRMLRTIKDRKKAQHYKANNFDYVTFSGVFTKRTDKNLVKHSSLLVVDFDHLKDVNKVKEKLFMDTYFETELLFTSPSGDGLKWLIKIDLKEETHSQYCMAVSRYLEETYGIAMDTSGQDVSRACYLPYDPDIFINPRYILHR